MNIFATFQKFGCALYGLTVDAKSQAALAQKKPDKVEDPGDGPGAGGGYERRDSVDVNPTSDGPGAGGGYDDVFRTDVPDSDGPGAGGGYSDGDAVPESAPDSDGPGAGGGYEDGDTVPDSDGSGAGGGYDSEAFFVSDGVSSSVKATWKEKSYGSPSYYFADGTTSIPLSNTVTSNSEWLLAAAQKPAPQKGGAE